MTTTAGRTTPLRTLSTLCIAASTVEWYDFFLYATAAATVLGGLFFAPLGPLGQYFAAFATFALAFLARPLGGVIFGMVGDRAGRRVALTTATGLMGAATALIGCLPSYALAGIAAPILLVVLRVGQGIALGGQWAGSVLLLTEQAPNHRRGLYGSIAQMGSPIGGVLSTGLFFLMNALTTPAQFAAWGWRIPFLVSVLFVGLALYVQRRIEDTPAFRALPRTEGRSRMPVLEVVRTQPGRILHAMCLFIAASASLYVWITFCLTYLSSPAIGFSRTTALLVTTVTQLFQAPGILAASMASDRWGRRPVYLAAATGSAIWAIVAFLLIDTRSVAAAVIALSVAHLLIGCLYGPLAAIFTELFSTRVRYSGASLGYQLGTVVGGGFAPLIATGLLAATHTSLTVSAYVVVVSLITITAAALLRTPSGTAIGPSSDP